MIGFIAFVIICQAIAIYFAHLATNTKDTSMFVYPLWMMSISAKVTGRHLESQVVTDKFRREFALKAAVYSNNIGFYSFSLFLLFSPLLLLIVVPTVEL